MNDTVRQAIKDFQEDKLDALLETERKYKALKQAIDDAQKTWYDPDNFVFLKYDETDSDEGVQRGMYGEGWKLYSLLEIKDVE